VFLVGQGQVAPIAARGGVVPLLPDGRGSGLVFADSFQLVPGSGRAGLPRRRRNR